jgi:hypothetical protein
MKNYSILNVNVVADTNGVYIAPNNGIKPNTAIVAHNHIAR